MQGAWAMGGSDIDWAVDVLARRRAALVPYAPLYWRPAADALERHRAYLAHLIGGGGGFGFRTDDALMIAAPGPGGWTIDDAWVPPGRWEHEGHGLWTRATATIGATDVVRFVCPCFEPERTSFVRRRGLVLANSWWHATTRTKATADEHAEPQLTGARATLVTAPPVYDPGGPILFLQDIHDLAAIDRSRAEAARCGSPLVVVDQPVGADDLARALIDGGFIRHCDFLLRPGRPR